MPFSVKGTDAEHSLQMATTFLKHMEAWSHHFSYLAAAASRFFALGAPGSTERDLAANKSLLDAMEMFLRFPITWIWSSFVCKVKRRQSH